MNLIKLNIVGISYSQFKSGAYALFLEEDQGLKKREIWGKKWSNSGLVLFFAHFFAPNFIFFPHRSPYYDINLSKYVLRALNQTYLPITTHFGEHKRVFGQL